MEHDKQYENTQPTKDVREVGVGMDVFITIDRGNGEEVHHEQG